MSKPLPPVPVEAWKIGSVWTASTERGDLEAVITGVGSRSGYKRVRMTYLNGRKAGPKWAVEQEYSHAHMRRYFKFSSEGKS